MGKFAGILQKIKLSSEEKEMVAHYFFNKKCGYKGRCNGRLLLKTIDKIQHDPSFRIKFEAIEYVIRESIARKV